jgi:hypothetical protein
MFLTYFLVLLVFLMYLFDTLVKVFVAIFLFFDKIHVFLVIPHFHHFKYCLIEFLLLMKLKFKPKCVINLNFD